MDSLLFHIQQSYLSVLVISDIVWSLNVSLSANAKAYKMKMCYF